ncbi:peptide chain release factor N(5)-glutamine methyltransferase [Parvibaculaceae bacterium PLY_AMNH_Bact1]|nr:peptide chain release factor N(5)-glutamine methyltransferase [Parvibaculaceae bacterium PLY_AMNH_Bact1]
MSADGHPGAVPRGVVYRDLLDQFRAADIPSAELDARLLMAAATQVDEVALIADPDQLIADPSLELLKAYVDRRLSGEPVSRILGHREFWGLTFSLNGATLDPRPDSETLVEAVLDHVTARGAPSSILDLGTGTGCLLLALLSELPNARGRGIDCAPEAVEAATHNAEQLGLADRVTFSIGNWGAGLDRPFDLIVSNPPYIPSADIAGLSQEVREHDPMTALDGGDDGLTAYQEIARETQRLLAPAGVAFWELGIGQSDDVSGIAAGVGLEVCGLHSDLAGIPRVLKVKRGM